MCVTAMLFLLLLVSESCGAAVMSSPHTRDSTIMPPQGGTSVAANIYMCKYIYIYMYTYIFLLLLSDIGLHPGFCRS